MCLPVGAPAGAQEARASALVQVCARLAARASARQARPSAVPILEPRAVAGVQRSVVGDYIFAHATEDASGQRVQANAGREAAKQSEQRSKRQAKKKPAKHADACELRSDLSCSV